MKCNPLRWLWGLLPLIALWWIGLLAGQPRIEEDLAQRAKEQLERNGLPWASVVFKGRDGMLVGRAEEESDQRRPLAEVAKVWGVRALEDRIEVLQLVKNYVWKATATDTLLSLTGYVPNEAARKAVLAAARSQFPKHKIDDKMDLARGAPEQKVWLGGTNFALRQLVSLKSGGHAGLEGAGLVVEGEADSSKVYETLRAALATGLPQGISLKSERIVPPLAKPYTWSAALRGRQIELTGHAPSIPARQQIKAAADRVLAGGSVVDRTVISSGGPPDWQKVAAAVLSHLGQLKQGSAEMIDGQLTFTGLTETEAAAEAVRKALKSDVPSSFRLIERVAQDPAAKAAEEARRAAEEAQREAARRAAAEAEARRVVELQKQENEAQTRARLAEETARQKAEDDARRASEEAARHKAAETEAARRAAAEAEARRAADDGRARAQAAAQTAAADAASRGRAAEAKRCQQALTSAAEAGSITFSRASADIDRGSYRTLNALAQIVKGCPGFAIEVAGHTDNEGEPDRKQRLSERRAEAVLNYLVKAGVPAASLTSAGYSDSRPKVANDSPANMARNRRIEFSVKPK